MQKILSLYRTNSMLEDNLKYFMDWMNSRNIKYKVHKSKKRFVTQNLEIILCTESDIQNLTDKNFLTIYTQGYATDAKSFETLVSLNPLTITNDGFSIWIVKNTIYSKDVI